MTLETNELVRKIEEANEAYRTGTAIVTDEVYDSWVDELTEIDPDNPVLAKIGFISDEDERKQKLPLRMASMDKIKSISDMLKWIVSMSIPRDTQFVLTPKYDGCSFCSEEDTRKAYTRGDGVHGQRSDDHLQEIPTVTFEEPIITFGEVIMERQIFVDNYSEDFKNPRNLVSGLLNAKDARPALNDCHYIRYGISADNMVDRFGTKANVLDYLNSKQPVKVPYRVVTVDDLTDDYMRELFIEWSKEFEIDGIIVEINDIKICEQFGRERNFNPKYARAFKGEFEERKTSTVVALEYNVSKKGHAVPRIQIEPIELDGVTVTYITGNNAKYIMEMGIGVGAEVLVKRSGMVIPYIIETTKRVDFEMPNIGYELKWDATKTHLVTTEETPEQRLQQIISFFKILGVENVSEGVCTQFFEAGYDTVKKILSMTREDMESIERFGTRKAEIVHGAIHSKMKDVTLSKLQHASGFFEMLGSKKLLLLEHLENPTANEIINIEGFSDKSAKAYLEALPKFNDFVGDLTGLVTVKKTEKKEASSNEMSELVFVFTGVRRPDLVEIIEDRGGRVASGVSAKITHLVMKAKGSGSSKEQKALSLGKEIITVDELEEMLGV
jgi:DNA ligase (NAD+)